MTEHQDGAAKILAECAALLQAKGADYNRGSVKRDDYYLYGRKSLMTMVHTKYLRLRSLCEAEDKENFESLRDTLVDLINYGAIWADWEDRHADRG